MEMKKYELWRSQNESCDAFFEVGDQNKRQFLPSDAQLLLVIEAVSWNEAQQKRYDWMGCGHYITIEEETGAA